MRIATQAIAPAGEVELMIRPERLRLATSDTGGANNTFDMTVDDVINYGNSLLVIGKTHGLPLRAWSAARPTGCSRARHGTGLRAPGDAHLFPCPRAARDSAM